MITPKKGTFWYRFYISFHADQMPYDVTNVVARKIGMEKRVRKDGFLSAHRTPAQIGLEFSRAILPPGQDFTIKLVPNLWEKNLDREK